MCFKGILNLVLFFMIAFMGIGFAETKQGDTKAYPATPEGVVNNFLNYRSKLQCASCWPETCKKLLIYIIDGESNSSETCGGGEQIISGFKILKTKINGASAEVTVKHFFCGGCANDGSCRVEKTEPIGSYKLLKVKNKWKITEWFAEECSFPCDGWMTVEDAIKLNNEAINKNFQHLGTKEELNHIINELKQCK
jgi:hypothetical protein